MHTTNSNNVSIQTSNCKKITDGPHTPKVQLIQLRPAHECSVDRQLVTLQRSDLLSFPLFLSPSRFKCCKWLPYQNTINIIVNVQCLCTSWPSDYAGFPACSDANLANA